MVFNNSSNCTFYFYDSSVYMAFVLIYIILHNNKFSFKMYSQLLYVIKSIIPIVFKVKLYNLVETVINKTLLQKKNILFQVN